MPQIDMIRIYIDYHQAMTLRVWESIAQLTEEQFVQEDIYSRGSIRNLMVHLTSTDRRWLAGLKNQEDVGHRRADDYPDLASARAFSEGVLKDLADYVATLSEADLEQSPNDLPNPRWQVLLHMINHGTDHRATILQRLTEFGAPTFDQDFILWLWSLQ